MLPLDLPVFHFINANHQSPLWWIQAARLASSWLPLLCALPVIAAMLALGKGWQRSLRLTLASMACAWLICRLIRWGFPMPRPAQLRMGWQWIEHGASASFPSMHAAGAFAFAQGITLGVSRHRRPLVLCAWVLAGCVALSRVVLGVHFPSDILAGLLTGVASAALVWRTTLHIRRARHRKHLREHWRPTMG